MPIESLIRGANLMFVLSSGALMLWLLGRSLISGLAWRSSAEQKSELLLEIFRDRASVLRLLLTKKRYLIGRGPDCDIVLKGVGIPLRLGEISRDHGRYFFYTLKDGSAAESDQRIAKGRLKLIPGGEITIHEFRFEINSAMPR